jgi:hypothetical protein
MVKKRQANAIERRQKILETLNRDGIWSHTYKEFAEEFGVSITQIYKDFNFIFNHIPKEELEILKGKLKLIHEQNLKALEPLLRDSNKNIRLRAIEQRGKEIERYTKFLEAWGLKEKIAEKIEHTGKLHIDVFKKYLQEK